MHEQGLVCDTTVLLYFGRIGLLNVLPVLFTPICIPNQVVTELDMGRISRSDTVDPRTLTWIEIVNVTQTNWN